MNNVLDHEEQNNDNWRSDQLGSDNTVYWAKEAPVISKATKYYTKIIQLILMKIKYK